MIDMNQLTKRETEIICSLLLIDLVIIWPRRFKKINDGSTFAKRCRRDDVERIRSCVSALRKLRKENK